MLLIIHNLPSKIRYSQVKTLIRDRCDLKDLIVDNLVYESPQSRKVTIGLTDENDARIVTKELHGLVYMGQKLYVENLQKHKVANTKISNPDKGYGRGNLSIVDSSSQVPTPTYMPPEPNSAPYYMTSQDKNQVSAKSNDGHSQPPIQPISAVPPYMQNSPYNTPYFMYGQGSSTAIPQSPNITQPPYSSPIPPVQNTNIGYGQPTNYGNNKPMTVTSNPPAFIPCGNAPQNDYSGNDSGKRYYEENIDQVYRDRNVKPSTSRADRETYDPRSRPDERQHDWDSDRYERTENWRSDKNPPKDSYNQSYDRNYKPGPEESGLKRNSGDRRNTDNSENYGNDYRRFDNNQDNYNRPRDRVPESINVNSRFKWVKNNENNNSNFGGHSDSKPGSSKEGNYSKNDFNSNNKFGNKEDSFNEPTIYLSEAEYRKIKKERNRKTSKLMQKDGTWRGQATSKIVKTALEESGLMNQAKQPGFVQFMKSIVKTRIDKMLGHRVAVPEDKIIEEYNRKYPPHIRKNFVLESKAKFNKITDFPSGAAPIRRPLMNQAPAEKRKATDEPQPSPAPKKKPPVDIPRPPPYRPPSPGPLPKYPNADKQAYKKLKNLAKEEHEKEIYTLEPNLKVALENEIKELRELFIKGCRNNKGGEDEKICKLIEKTTDEVMKVIKLDITKRLLNVTCNLPLRMFVNDRFKVREIGPLLKPYGIISCRKSPRSKLCVVVCQDFPSYDYLCTKGEIDVGNGLILSFKPLHLAGPKKRPNKKANKLGTNDQSGDEDEVFGEETAEGIIDEIAGDDEMAEEFEDESDENIDEKETVGKNEEIVDSNIKQDEDITIVESDQKNEASDVKSEVEQTAEKAVEIKAKETENTEIKNLVNDIKQLTDNIVNDSKSEDIQEVEALDVSNIGVDDLEDY